MRHPWRRITSMAAVLALPSLMVLTAAGSGGASAAAAGVVDRAPLRTSGAKIVDRNGAEIVLQGVNWFGFETQNHVTHGLWTRDYKEMLAQIRLLGFNTIRLPFSVQAMRSSTTSGIDFGGGRNAALNGKTPLEAMDVIIQEANTQGLFVMLDNHSLADDDFGYDLWYGNGYTEDDWVATWQMLAQRYKAQPNVIAADLKNEPHGQATWGDGAPTDWRRAATRAGNAVLGIAPNWLIVVEGVENQVPGQQLPSHWWGGNLEAVRSHPVTLNTPNRLVYSPHEYGPGVYNQPWFGDPNYQSVLYDRWAKGFQYIADQGIAPILVGEFGGRQTGPDTIEGVWQRQFMDYLGKKGFSWTYWAWNPNSGDTGGVLTTDWRTVDAPKMALLTELIGRQAIDFPGSGTAPPTTAAPPPTTTTAADDDHTADDNTAADHEPGRLVRPRQHVGRWLLRPPGGDQQLRSAGDRAELQLHPPSRQPDDLVVERHVQPQRHHGQRHPAVVGPDPGRRRPVHPDRLLRAGPGPADQRRGPRCGFPATATAADHRAANHGTPDHHSARRRRAERRLDAGFTVGHGLLRHRQGHQLLVAHPHAEVGHLQPRQPGDPHRLLERHRHPFGWPGDGRTRRLDGAPGAGAVVHRLRVLHEPAGESRQPSQRVQRAGALNPSPIAGQTWMASGSFQRETTGVSRS